MSALGRQQTFLGHMHMLERIWEASACDLSSKESMGIVAIPNLYWPKVTSSRLVFFFYRAMDCHVCLYKDIDRIHNRRAWCEL